MIQALNVLVREKQHQCHCEYDVAVELVARDLGRPYQEVLLAAGSQNAKFVEERNYELVPTVQYELSKLHTGSRYKLVALLPPKRFS